MEENYKKPGSFLNAEKLLVDREVTDPFASSFPDETIYTHPFHDGRSTGYIRYAFHGNVLVILDSVITGTR